MNRTTDPVETLAALEQSLNELSTLCESISRAADHLLEHVSPEEAWKCTAISSMAEQGTRLVEKHITELQPLRAALEVRSEHA